MKKSFIVTLVAVLAFAGVATAQTSDWSTYNGGQVLVKMVPGSADLGKGWSSFVKGVFFTMPTQNFTQYWGYAGARKGVTTLYGGLAFNWNGYDPFFAGINLDVPFGRCLWSTELDGITNTDFFDQYLWMGLDVNYTVFGEHALWFGPQVEAIRSGKTCAQVGARLGYDKFEFGFYAGDRGYNARVTITVPLH